MTTTLISSSLAQTIAVPVVLPTIRHTEQSQPMTPEPATEHSPLILDGNKATEELGNSGEKSFKLQRTIGVASAAAILFGNCVGAGIFISPKGVYEKTGSAGAGLVVWALAGIIATLCTVTYAELGTLFQESGGEFVYIKKAFGKLPAFLFSFCTAFLIKPAAMAVVVSTFSEYVCVSIYGEASPNFIRMLSLCTISLVMVINIISVKVVVKVCTIISILKLVIVGFLLACGVAIVIKGQGHLENFSKSSFAGSNPNITDYGLAFYFALYSYQSWNSLNFMTEELKAPERTLPIGGGLGMTGVTFSYVLANVAYLLMFRVSFIMDSTTIAMDSGMLAFGKIGWFIMLIGLLLSCLGCLTGGVFTLARNIQSTGESGLFPQWTSYVSPLLSTPVAGVVITCMTTSVYLFFDVVFLIPCLSTAEWFFYFITFVSLLVFRYRLPKQHRPVKVPIFIPIALTIITFAFVILPLFNPKTRMSVGIGFGFIALGAILYYIRIFITKLCIPSAGVMEVQKPYAIKKSSSTDSGLGDI